VASGRRCRESRLGGLRRQGYRIRESWQFVRGIGEIVPVCSGTQHPKHTVDENTVVRSGTTYRIGPTRQQALDPAPLPITQLIPTNAHVNRTINQSTVAKSICRCRLGIYRSLEPCWTPEMKEANSVYRTSSAKGFASIRDLICFYGTAQKSTTRLVGQETSAAVSVTELQNAVAAGG
jgi:hypothetical protein